VSSIITDTLRRRQAERRTALLPYLTVGFPDIDATPDLAEALACGGADLIELGVPFSDPIADGVSIQRAGQRSLSNGVDLARCLDTAERCRQRTSVPLILMGYYNPFLQYGLDRLCREAADCGVAGFIVPDLPPEESDDMRDAACARGLDVVFLAALTSSEARLDQIGQMSAGFVYCVTVRGVTGARTTLSPELPGFLDRVRQHTALPLAAGFGISTPEHVRDVGRHADAAVVASALVNLLEQTEPAERPAAAERFVRWLAEGTAPHEGARG